MGREHGDIHWSELMTREPEAAAAFFEKTLGWTFSEMPMAGGAVYRVAMKNEQPVAGVFKMDGPEFEGLPPHWMTYIAVDDVDATVGEVAAAGGKVMKPVFEVPGVGRIAIVADPSGGVVGMMTPANPQG